MSSISSAKTIVAEERLSIYDNLPSLESWYQTPTLQEESCLKRIRRKNNKVVSFCPNPQIIYNDETSVLSKEQYNNNNTTVGCCGNIKVKSFIRSLLNNK